MRVKAAVFGVIFPVVMVLDVITKRWALDALAGGHRMELFGGLIPLTLAFNRGAAFGLEVGEDSRWFFVPVTLLALVILVKLFIHARGGDLLRLASLSLVVAGAVGNLYDRLRWSLGVVDFIGPVWLGFAHFPIFNVADIAITCGAVMLATSFWLEERAERRHGGSDAPPSASTG
ncbi:MAG: signal peptidase II [Gemmatimonadota bacterium]|nr:signal peptidase II [Gemmatimonadota bacterium]